MSLCRCSHLSGRHLCPLSLDRYCWGGIGSAKQLLPIQRFCSPTKEAFEKALLRRLRHLHALLQGEFWVWYSEQGSHLVEISKRFVQSFCVLLVHRELLNLQEKLKSIDWSRGYLVLVCEEKTRASSGEADSLGNASWSSGSRVDIHDEGRFCQRPQRRQGERLHFPVRCEGEEERGALVLAPVDGLGDDDGGALRQGVGGNLPLAGQGKRARPTLRPNCQDKLVALRRRHLAPVLTSDHSTGDISTCCLHALEVRPENVLKWTSEVFEGNPRCHLSAKAKLESRRQNSRMEDLSRSKDPLGETITLSLSLQRQLHN